MSPRPRKVSDDDIFAAAYRAMQRLGPGELTLAEIAAEAGVTASALSQRFGSKQELMLALSQASADATPSLVQSLRAKARTPLAAIHAYGACMAGMARSPEALARSLAYLQVDLTDETLRTALAGQARKTRKAFEEILVDAIAAGELRRDTDVRKLAQLLETVISGALFTWAVHVEGTALHWMRARVTEALRPYLRQGRS